MRRCGFAALAAWLAAACCGCAAVPDPAQRLAAGQVIAAQAGWVMTQLPTRPPMAAAHAGELVRGDVLTVYIEGDGFAWRTREWPSSDPTPVDPVALRLATLHAGGPVAWLARPCQYVDAEASGCPVALWTSEPYGEAALTAAAQALDLLKARHGATHLRLFGYSGGGTLAALLAAQRTDTVGLVTVAANLDLDHWRHHHGLPPAPGTPDPAALAHRLSGLPQLHIVGGRDTVVPPATVRSYVARLGHPARARVVEIDIADHHCCWTRLWPQLLDSAEPAVATAASP